MPKGERKSTTSPSEARHTRPTKNGNPSQRRVAVFHFSGRREAERRIRKATGLERAGLSKTGEGQARAEPGRQNRGGRTRWGKAGPERQNKVGRGWTGQRRAGRDQAGPGKTRLNQAEPG